MHQLHRTIHHKIWEGRGRGRGREREGRGKRKERKERRGRGRKEKREGGGGEEAAAPKCRNYGSHEWVKRRIKVLAYLRSTPPHPNLRSF
jgi:hypothetical protein